MYEMSGVCAVMRAACFLFICQLLLHTVAAEEDQNKGTEGVLQKKNIQLIYTEARVQAVIVDGKGTDRF